MGYFSGIENAKTSDRLPSLSPGNYLLEVGTLKVIKSRKGKQLFVAEFSVLESQGTGANAAGTEASHLMDMSQDSFLGNLKGFLGAVAGGDAKSITESDADEAIADDQPLRGLKVRANAMIIQTKAGDDFTLVSYRPYVAAANDDVEIPAPEVVTATPTKGKRKSA